MSHRQSSPALDERRIGAGQAGATVAEGTQHAQVVVRLSGSDEVEVLPGEPLGANRYRLAASSYRVPLAEGDLALCAAPADGRAHLVGVVPADAVLTVFAPADGTDLDALVERWRGVGAGHVQGRGPVVVTVWPGVAIDAVADRLNADEDAGLGQWILAAEQHERAQAQQSDIDFG